MAHHGDGPKGFMIDDPDVLARLAEKHPELRPQTGPGLGPTGQFPKGQLHPDDKGELRMRLGIVEGRILLDFGTLLSWVAFTDEEALRLAQGLMAKRAELLRR
jgi:hypothetical protein